MSAFQTLFLIFLLVPLAEIYLLIKVGGIVGALPTVILVVLTALIGAVLVRWQGISTLFRAQQSLQRGELPAIALLEGALILIAGALLLTPGFLTDALGFACLVPSWRQGLITWFLSRKGTMSAQPPHGPSVHRGRGGNVIEGEYEREDDRKF